MIFRNYHVFLPLKYAFIFCPCIQCTDKKGYLAIESGLLIRLKATIIMKQRTSQIKLPYILYEILKTPATSTKTGVKGSF